MLEKFPGICDWTGSNPPIINPPEYYKYRFGNDIKRQKAFYSERDYIFKYIQSGKLLDVGCSTGEFINAINWDGETYGMEISPYAVEHAKGKGVRFDRHLFNSSNYFDIIVFRGSLQNIDTPFFYIKRSYVALKDEGYLVFLATANANSIYYKLWNTFPFLDLPNDFYVPSDHSLINALNNFGFKLVEIRYPYWKSPYKSFLRDHCKFLLKLLGLPLQFPFWRNMMDLIVQKVPRTQ